ncbi:hypothetical protein FRB90_008228 [Tulasnella sp. 427]|nr:hypothetical protein FRB90_008228 [Tulasnella sp. 427]
MHASESFGSDHNEQQQKLVRDVIKALEHAMLFGLNPTTEGSDATDRQKETLHFDNHIQREAIRQFSSFKKSVRNLDHKLDDFTRAVRPLGSSSQLILSARNIGERMADIQNAFRLNSCSIYKTYGDKSVDQELPDIFEDMPSAELEPPATPQKFHKLFYRVSEELDDFMKSLSDIPEFSDKKLSDSILAFETWLMYRAHDLREFRSPDTPEILRYRNCVMLEMTEYMVDIGKALAQFSVDGVTALKEAQDRAKEQLLNMSTVATFFSGVAATTFSYTAGEEHSILDQMVRALWVSSLILSIASAINSQLAMHWRAAMYRSPRSALPMWTSLCLDHTPLLFLVAAVLTFSVGLVGYTYSSSQGKAVTLSATALTSFTSLILLTVIVWEAGERWQVSKSRRSGRVTDGNGAPVQGLWEPYADAKRFSFAMARIAFDLTRRSSMILLTPLSLLVGLFSACLRRNKQNEDKPPRSRSTIPGHVLPPPVTSRRPPVPEIKLDNGSKSSLESNAIPDARPAYPPIPDLSIDSPSLGPEESPPPTPTASSRPFWGPREIMRKSVLHLIQNPNAREVINAVPMAPYESKTLRGVEVAAHIPIADAPGAVRDLVFSPDGNWMAASFSDTTAVWTTTGSFTTPHGSFSGRHSSLKWAPDSRFILAKQMEEVVVWSPETKSRKALPKRKLEAAAWMPGGSSFAAVHKQKFYIFSAESEVVEPHLPFPSHLRIHDIAAIPCGAAQGEGLIIAVASVRDESWHRGGRPKDANSQRRIIIYDIASRTICVQLPIWGEARSVAVSKNGRFALISYAAPDPPELWRIGASDPGQVSLELCHLYMPITDHTDSTTPTTDFIEQARFGGDSDEYIVASTKRQCLISRMTYSPYQLSNTLHRIGGVYTWDTESNQLRHFVQDARGNATTSQITSINWCPTNKEMRLPMFGCGLDGAGIVIWKGKSGEPRTNHGHPGPGDSLIVPSSSASRRLSIHRAREVFDDGVPRLAHAQSRRPSTLFGQAWKTSGDLDISTVPWNATPSYHVEETDNQALCYTARLQLIRRSSWGVIVRRQQHNQGALLSGASEMALCNEANRYSGH